MESYRFNKRSAGIERTDTAGHAHNRHSVHAHLGKVARIGILVTVAVAAAITLYLIVQRRNGNGETAHESAEEVSTKTFYSDPESPPELDEVITGILEKSGYAQTEERESADIKIENISFDSDNSDESDKNVLNLYQVWGVALPLNESVNLEPTIGEVSERIDTQNPSELLEEFFPISVSPETNAGNTARLITLSEILPSERFIDVGEYGNPIDLGKRDVIDYPLISHVRIEGKYDNLDILSDNSVLNTFMSEFDYRFELPNEDSFVTIVKTGTTVTGGPGWELCERVKGRAAYPIESIQDVLSEADISLISNETSFVEGCSQPAGTTSFCGKPSYLQNILDMGIDIVSLTGNHMCDYGKGSFSDMLATYTENDIAYFGAGNNTDDAWKPLVVDTPAGKIAFIGYNMMGPGGVLSTETEAGTAYYNKEKLTEAMETARDESDLIWVDTHLWPEYGTSPSEDQINLTEEAIDLGADIVTGVSSHEVQGMTFYKNKPVFYGLGNFLFDQMWSTETRQGMVLSITLFEEKIVNIDLMPTMMYDYCQPRFMEGTEKETFLDYFFGISDI